MSTASTEATTTTTVEGGTRTPGPTRGRTWLLLLLSAFFLTAAATLHVIGRVSLVRTELLSGPTLFLCLVFLSAYGLRRLVPQLHWVSAGAWIQLHVWLGYFTAVLFLVHTRFRIPNGLLESGLAVLYALVMLSGILGYWLSRRLARRLRRAGDNGNGDDAPEEARVRLREQAEDVVEKAMRETGSSALADLYQASLTSFFAGPRNTLAHLVDSRRPRQRLLAEVAIASHDLSRAERELVAQLVDLIRAKDELDHISATQTVLDGWLYLHLPLTFLLLIAAALHAVVARSFLLGGVP